MTTSADKPKSHSLEWLFCILVALALLGGCGEPELEGVHLSGRTMGTTWNVTYTVRSGTPDAIVVEQAIQIELDAVNGRMSTYQKDSELSQLNDSPPDTGWMPVSEPLFTVIQAALKIGEQSDGAYDITVAPLVDLWGFGPDGPANGVPAASEIEIRLGQLGQHYIELDTAQSLLRKTRPLRIDLSSIAKGYAVDQVATALETRGITDYLVEVGGEMRLAGSSPRGDTWRIAIEQPSAGSRIPARALSLTDAAVATSGDYRNFFEMDGKRYSHSIDPHTGYPVAHDLVSVTVIDPSAMQADAWATALEVLGADAAMAVAKEQGLAVYLIQRRGDAFVASHSPAFSRYLNGESNRLQDR